MARHALRRRSHTDETWFTCRAAGRTGEVAVYDEIGAWGVTAKDFIAEVKGLGELDTLTVSIMAS